jgi:hypothetical protein
MFWKLFPFIFSAPIVGAHFLRSGNLLLAAVCALFPFLLLLRKPWVLIAGQVFAYLGSVLWVLTAVEIANRRILFNEPWARMAAILGGVALLTLVGGLMLNHKQVREHYHTPALPDENSQSE